MTRQEFLKQINQLLDKPPSDWNPVDVTWIKHVMRKINWETVRFTRNVTGDHLHKQAKRMGW